MDLLNFVHFFLFFLTQPLKSEPQPGHQGISFSVQQAVAMDNRISTIEDYRQYLQSIQKIYLKQSFLLPFSKYDSKHGIGLRNSFDDGEHEMLTV